MLDKNKIRFLFLMFVLAVIFSTCDSSMGMGPTVDLEPATLKITGIVLPDGTEIPLLEDDNKLFVGPGILVGPGFYLKGTASDNEKVVEITVEETGAGAEIVDGKPRMWSNANISLIKSVSGVSNEYEWSISLDGISPGERNILVTVYDFPGNIGPDSVKQLTLLVDLSPPFVDKINIERQPGITVGLLPRTRLEEMDPESFENIDYFQNEYFTIRASISHNFSLTGVHLNFIGEDEKALFENGLERIDGTTVYAPSWHITAEQLISANGKYATGRHYLKVQITARAEAGHSGGNEDKTNILYNLCWYPEADIPKMQMTVPPSGANEEYRFEKGNKIPVRVFDDDNAGEVYASLVPLATWNGYMPSSGEDDKLRSLINNFNNSQFPELNDNRLPSPSRNAVIEVDAGETRGDYRLVVFTKEAKDSGKTGVWGWKLFKISIVEEGIPIISVDSPTANSTPALSNGKNFTLSGNVQNLDDLDKVRIAWVPAGAAKAQGWDANTEGQEALKGDDTGVIGNGIKIWEIDLQPGTLVSNKWKKQTFSLTFDIFADFLYNGSVENETKLFIIYVKGKGGDDVFENFSVLPYTKLPNLTISPASYHEISPGGTVNFIITAVSPNGVEIETNRVTLRSINGNSFISLTRNGNVWTGTATPPIAKGEYDYEITAEDRLGFKNQQTVTITVTSPPVLKNVTSPHNSGVVFSSRDTITIQLVFDSPVTTVTGTPRLTLGGLTSTTTRYATYSGGADTTTLNFSYKVQEDDYTGVPGGNTGLTVTAFDLNSGTVSADIDTSKIIALTAQNKLPSTKRLYVDGINPKISGIVITGTAANGWNREGEDITVNFTVSKEIRVLGTPKLRLQFNGSAIKTRIFKLRKATIKQ